jgi:hypothetical protein
MSVQRKAGTDGKVRYRARVKSNGREVASRMFDRRSDAVAWEQDQRGGCGPVSGWTFGGVKLHWPRWLRCGCSLGRPLSGGLWRVTWPSGGTTSRHGSGDAGRLDHCC